MPALRHLRGTCLFASACRLMCFRRTVGGGWWSTHNALRTPLTTINNQAPLQRYSHHSSAGWCWNPYDATTPPNDALVSAPCLSQRKA